MEEKSASIWKSSLLAGVYLGIVLILISVIFYVTGNTFSKTAQYISYPIFFIGILWPQVNHRNKIGIEVKYGEIFVIGLLTMVFASIISSIYTFFLYTIIDPSLQEQMRLFTEEQMMKQGSVSEEQME